MARTISTANLGAMLDSLSNVELATVLDGGSAHVVARPKGTDDWTSACIDLDGLWLDDVNAPGYVFEPDLPKWEVDRHA